LVKKVEKVKISSDLRSARHWKPGASFVFFRLFVNELLSRGEEQKQPQKRLNNCYNDGFNKK